MIDFDPYFLKYINHQRVKMLRLIAKGVNSIDDLSHALLIGKNVVKRHARLLENIGIIKVRNNFIDINKTPRNLALLLSIGVLSLSDFFRELKEYMRAFIENYAYKALSSNFTIHFLSDGGILIESSKNLSDNVKSKIAEKILKELGFTYVWFK